jgi:hypothetical protein
MSPCRSSTARLSKSTHPSAPAASASFAAFELSNLIAAAEKVCESETRKTPATTWLRRRASALTLE